MKKFENVELSPEKVARAFRGEEFKVEAPEVTLYDFQIEGFIYFTQANINKLKEQAELKDSPTLAMIARFFESDLNGLKSVIKRRVLQGGLSHV